MRIIAGAWRGRPLLAPVGDATRPTADRVRQALFDVLTHASWFPGWDGLRVLDAFAGTGALGLEALSRGAAHATFFERDRAALGVLRANVAACQAGDRATVRAGDALRPPRPASGDACGLVFLDPPYGRGLVPAGLRAVASWLAPGALVVTETGPEEALEGEMLLDRTHGVARLRVFSSG